MPYAGVVKLEMPQAEEPSFASSTGTLTINGGFNEAQKRTVLSKIKAVDRVEQGSQMVVVEDPQET